MSVLAECTISPRSGRVHSLHISWKHLSLFDFPQPPVHHRFDLSRASVLLLWSRRETDADGCQQEGAGAQPERHIVVVQPVVEPARGQRPQARAYRHRDPLHPRNPAIRPPPAVARPPPPPHRPHHPP